MNETGSGTRSRIAPRVRFAAACLALWLVWKGWGGLGSTSVPAYERARARDEIFRGAVDIFPKTSTKEARLVRFRHFDKTFMWADHVLVARFEGVDSRFVNELRERYCSEAATEYDLEVRAKQSAEKWRRYVGAVLAIRDRFADRRKDFEYCPVSYTLLPGSNHTETAVWLERGGRAAILYGEFYSG